MRNIGNGRKTKHMFVHKVAVHAQVITDIRQRLGVVRDVLG